LEIRFLPVYFNPSFKTPYMQYRSLGRTGLPVSMLSFGSWVSFHKQIGDTEAAALMHQAYDAGVNFFDNAEVYAHGESERMMGRILKNSGWDRDSYCVSSKVFFGWRGEKNKPTQKGLHRKHIIEACHQALNRLEVDYLDFYFCHRPDKQTPILETVIAMNTLITQGKILYWGTSEWSATEIMEAWRVATEYRIIGPSMEQPQYNLFEREKMEAEYTGLFQWHGLGTTIWSPLASGLLSGKYLNGIPEGSRMASQGMEWLSERWLVQDKLEKVRKLAAIAADMGISLSQLSIAWCLMNPHVSTVILGATRGEQLKENLQAISAMEYLTSDRMEQIEQIMQNKPKLPAY